MFSQPCFIHSHQFSPVLFKTSSQLFPVLFHIYLQCFPVLFCTFPQCFQLTCSKSHCLARFSCLISIATSFSLLWSTLIQNIFQSCYIDPLSCSRLSMMFFAVLFKTSTQCFYIPLSYIPSFPLSCPTLLCFHSPLLLHSHQFSAVLFNTLMFSQSSFITFPPVFHCPVLHFYVFTVLFYYISISFLLSCPTLQCFHSPLLLHFHQFSAVLSYTSMFSQSSFITFPPVFCCPVQHFSTMFSSRVLHFSTMFSSFVLHFPTMFSVVCPTLPNKVFQSSFHPIKFSSVQSTVTHNVFQSCLKDPHNVFLCSDLNFPQCFQLS